jgi:D-sedoheptulose 7-phosphate isomerase
MSADKVTGTQPGRTHVVGPGGLDATEFVAWYRERILAQWHGIDVAAIAQLASWIADAQQHRRHVYLMGNGGSAATASHIATDYNKTAAVDHRPRLLCTCLNDNIATLTAIANDISFDDVFAYQLRGLVRADDVVIVISGSGNSKNLIAAVDVAKSHKARTVGMLGFDGGQLATLVDLPIVVASDQYGVIEDLHLGIGHMVTFFLKQRGD